MSIKTFSDDDIVKIINNPNCIYYIHRCDVGCTFYDPAEQRFITEYMKSGNARTAAELAGYENPNRFAELLKQPNIIREIDRLMEELKKDSLATADEVMSYFTSVMRGGEVDG